ncbi:hypothetical protein [Flavobacterium pectinovorum]|uniref:Uncharacterized protein n=1 Tax=Flavobacterium pectinovorum TaxID=29533 RepID=A0A502F6F7_9FLAO|nr:hypothetical protein [Flavobacterium pectinovorum]TPG44346.1 hypothetical protein EAH81_02410 [Flavobacterium pectinovorum]
MYLVKENAVYIRERETQFTLKETITLKQPNNMIYEKEDYDWYMSVALEKVDKVTQNRHLLTAELILRYRWAIREGYNHELDKNLKNKYDHPRNQNTVSAIQAYIKRIENASDAEMKG